MAENYLISLLKWTLITRLLFFTLQLLVSIIPDHQHSYNTALNDDMRTAVRDKPHPLLIEHMFGGYDNWDSEYYLFIAQYGYRYELNHAFFPLYPFLMRFIASVLFYPFHDLIPFYSLLLITGFLISNTAFIISTGILYILTVKIFSSANVPPTSVPSSNVPLNVPSSKTVPYLKRRPLSPLLNTSVPDPEFTLLDPATIPDPYSTNNNLTMTQSTVNELAYLTVLIYSINPASVFMTSVYTESIFAMFSFSGMLAITKSCPFLAALLFAGASGTRSNGTVTAGFIIYYHLFHTLKDDLWTRTHSIARIGMRLLTRTISMLLQITIIFLPFITFQAYSYFIICDNTTVTTADKSILCTNSLMPLPYSYIQKQYWGLGFLKFYEFKQAPNFLLATPIYLITGHGLWQYCKRTSCNIKQYTTTTTKTNRILDAHKRNALYLDAILLPYYVQLLFLLIVAALFMHIQVITRFICSSSPVVYWLIAFVFLENRIKYKKNDIYNTTSSWQYLRHLFTSLNWKRLLQCSRTSWQLQWIAVYFITFNIIGFIMYCNFLPWV